MNVFFVNNESSSEALEYLEQNDIEFRRVELQGNDKAIEYVKNVCGEERNVYMASRTKALVEPTAADIAYFVQGKKTEGKRRNFDVLIAGGGPAGLTCAIYASRANVSAAIVEKMMPGGLMTSTDEIENYPGFPDGIPGMDLSMKMAEQARKFGTEIISATVEHVRLEPDIKELNFGRDSLYGPNVLVCFGTEHRHIGIPGEEEYYGKGVSYCATCDGPLYRDKEMFVIGGGDSAIQEGIYLSNLGSKINIVHRRDELRAQDILQRRAFERDNINFIWDTVPLEILGDDKGVTGIRVKNKKTGEESEHSCEAVFVFIGLLPETDVKGLEVVEKDEDGFIVADNMMRTNVPGVYVAGDIRKDNPRQIAIATGDGCIASYSAEERNNNLEFPEWED